METYSLDQENILGLLSGNLTWFSNCVDENYKNYAKAYLFNLETSQLRLSEAFELWHQDIDRTLRHGIDESDELDPYKRAGFLAYWLRRRVVINDIELFSEAGDPSPPKLADHKQALPPPLKQFFNLYNEICAFKLGLDIIIFYAANSFSNVLIEQGISENEVEDRSIEYIKEIGSKGESLVVDTAVLMKQKNLSPHALYIIYKSLVKA